MMIDRRMLLVLNYLKENKESTFREISESLDIKERYVRYDIDKLNDVFILNKLPTIEKKAKGKLVFPQTKKLNLWLVSQNFLFSQEDRVAVILLILLLDNKSLKLNHLSEKLEVSRSTLKNDLKELEKELVPFDLEINYRKYFYLEGNSDRYNYLLYKELRKYNYLFFSDDERELPFDTIIKEIFSSAFNGISIKRLVEIIRKDLIAQEIILTDDSFEWYFTNTLIVIWSNIYQRDDVLDYHRFYYESNMLNIQNVVKNLEDEVKIIFTEEQMEYIGGLLNYTSKYSGLNENDDIMQAQAITFQLIDKMSEEIGMDFRKDEGLIKGLINHVSPLIKRINNKIEIVENILPVLSTRDLEVYEIVSRVSKRVDVLNRITSEEELTYITIHFLASIRRFGEASPKRVLLICGYGYGTSLMLKEALINEFQLEIIAVVPSYYTPSYDNWEEIDCVISTSNHFKLPVDKPMAYVNPILTDDDFQKISDLGIVKKKVLSHYCSINDNLAFLNDQNRLKVLEVIRKEFGYPPRNSKKKIRTLSDMLDLDRIQMIEKSDSWIDIVKESSDILFQNGFVDEFYGQEIIDSVNRMGYYSISDDHFALLHGSAGRHVVKSGMSMIVSKKAIRFGEKYVNFVFCLASKDNKEHIPALISLVRMVKQTSIIHDLKKAKNAEEILTQIYECERMISKND